MSTRCKYVYVQGLRFRPEDVTVLWKQSDGTIRPYTLAIGYMSLGPKGELLSLQPHELKATVKRGETMDARVRLANGEEVMLRLDPWKVRGRKGRKSFTPESLASLSLHDRRALALEQLKTAPYGSKNRNEAVGRILWSIDVLDDAEIASMLTDTADRTGTGDDRSSTPAELAALLASDKRIFRAMLDKTRTGPGRATALLFEQVAQASAELAYTGTSLEEMCVDIAWNDEDPALRVAAVRHMRNGSLLAKIALSDQDWPVRLAATERLAASTESSDALAVVAKTDSSAFVRSAAVAGISVKGHETLESLAEGDEDASVRKSAIERLAEVTKSNIAIARSGLRIAHSRVDLESSAMELHTQTQRFIARLAADDPSESVRAAAAALVEDHELLIGYLPQYRYKPVLGEADHTGRVTTQEDVDNFPAFSAQPILDELLARVVRGPGHLRTASERYYGYSELAVALAKAGDAETCRRLLDLMAAKAEPADEKETDWRSLTEGAAVGDTTSLDDAVRAAGQIVDALDQRLAAPSHQELAAAVHAVEALKDNPALPEELYAVATDLAARLRVDEMKAKERNRDARLAQLREAEMQELKASYKARHAADAAVIIRHLRHGDHHAAQRVLDSSQDTSYKATLHAAAVSLDDSDEIRELVELVLPNLKAGLLKFVRRDQTASDPRFDSGYDATTLAWTFMEYVCANPATPSDVLEIQIARSWDLEDHQWRDLLNHPNATPEQRVRVAERRAAEAAARERDRLL